MTSTAEAKVTICHRTGSDSNPYVEITVSQNALPAHEAHGDIIPAPAGGCPTALTGTPTGSVTATSTPTLCPPVPARPLPARPKRPKDNHLPCHRLGEQSIRAHNDRHQRPQRAQQAPGRHHPGPVRRLPYRCATAIEAQVSGEWQRQTMAATVTPMATVMVMVTVR